MHLLTTYHIAPNEALFIGDSDVDVATGHNSNLDVCLVTWGYGNYSNKLLEEATYVAQSIPGLKKIVFA